MLGPGVHAPGLPGGDPDAQFVKDSVSHPLRRVGDDEGGAHHAGPLQHKVRRQSPYKEGDEGVECLLPAKDQASDEDDGPVRQDIDLAYGDPRPDLEHTPQDARPCRGAAAPVDQAHADPAHDTAIQRAEQQIVGQPGGG